MDDCPYCSNIPLGTAVAPPRPATPFDQVLVRHPRVVVTPTLGMLTPGYLLAITTEHLSSFGCLGEEELAQDVMPSVNKVLSDLRPVFGSYLIFEHGSSEVAPFQGGCLTHAHLHLIPYPEHAVGVLMDALPWEPLSSMVALATECGSEYAYLSFGGASWLCREPGLPGQWIRRIVAPPIGSGDEWDWGVFPGTQHLGDTIRRLKAIGIPRSQPS
jgi:diadenosine tetraphosphate (Ap4A) HIT family hydrolase